MKLSVLILQQVKENCRKCFNALHAAAVHSN